MTGEDVEEGVRQLGLGRGDAVEVHSSLRSFGTVAGGATAVVDALMNVVGEDGALIMSAYPLSPPVSLTDEEKAGGLRWKLRLLGDDSDERSAMGAIADEFRRRTGVVCGTGIHRVCAWGREAHRHSKGCRRLLEIDGWVLLLGVGFDRCSSMHLAEESVGIPEKIQARFEPSDDIRRAYPAEVWEMGYGGTPCDPWEGVGSGRRRRTDQRGFYRPSPVHDVQGKGRHFDLRRTTPRRPVRALRRGGRRLTGAA